jgi:mannosyltransferase
LRFTPFSLSGRRAGGEGRGWWIAFVLTSLIGMYTHYFVAFVVIAEGLALLWAARRDRRLFVRLAIATAVISAVYAPWIPVQRQYAASQAYARWELLTPGVFVDVVRQTLTSWSVARYHVIPTKPFPGADWGTIVVAAAALVGAIGALRTRRVEAALVPLTAAIVLVLGWAINPILPVFQDRYLMIGAPAYLVLIGAGLQQISDFGLQISERPRRSTLHALRPTVLVVGVAAVIAPQAVALRAWFADPSFVKGEYGKAMTFISARAQPGDVLLLNNYVQWGLFDYYRPANVPAQLVPAGATASDAEAEAALKPLVNGKQRAWLVEFGYAAQYDPDHRAERWLAEHGYKQLAQDFVGLRVNLYDLGATPGQAALAHRLDAQLGQSILLTGYTLESDSVHSGDSVRLTLFWQAKDKISARYTVFAHLADSTGKPIAQTDSQPLGGTAPTDSWQVGATLADRYALAIQPGTPPGQYELRVGMYLWPDLTRLSVTLNGKPSGDYVPLTTIRVLP